MVAELHTSGTDVCLWLWRGWCWYTADGTDDSL